jgi:hypothetical protein
MDVLLDDVLKWKPESIPDGYITMLIKSSLNLSHTEKIVELVEKCSNTISTETIFAFIELL